MEHKRPILVSYVGLGKNRMHQFSSRWETKQQVRWL